MLPDDLKANGRLQELAGLDRLEYERVRRNAATELGVRVTTLDEEVEELRPPRPEVERRAAEVFVTDEPWPEPVNGSDLLDLLESAFRNYLALDEHASAALALWVLFAHAHDAASVSPILAITSPEKRCGKTTALRVLGRLVPKPLSTANITAAALFRAVEKWGPTLLIDEADTFLRGSDDLRGILNSGHDQTSAFVIRTVGDDHEPRRFATWAPKAIALIGSLHPTLEDRSIVIPMRRRMPGEEVERLCVGDPGDEGTWSRIRSKCGRWSMDHLQALRFADPETPRSLHDRAADNWRSLLAIADQAGGGWVERARGAAIALTPKEDTSLATLLLLDIRSMLGGPPALERIRSFDLVERLLALEDRPWRECQGNRRGALTTHGLAGRLRPFGIKPEKIRFGESTAQGYRCESFEEAFSRYIPPHDPEPRNNATGPVGYSAFGHADDDDRVPADGGLSG